MARFQTKPVTNNSAIRYESLQTKERLVEELDAPSIERLASMIGTIRARTLAEAYRDEKVKTESFAKLLKNPPYDLLQFVEYLSWRLT